MSKPMMIDNLDKIKSQKSLDGLLAFVLKLEKSKSRSIVSWLIDECIARLMLSDKCDASMLKAIGEGNSNYFDKVGMSVWVVSRLLTREEHAVICLRNVYTRGYGSVEVLHGILEDGPLLGTPDDLALIKLALIYENPEAAAKEQTP